MVEIFEKLYQTYCIIGFAACFICLIGLMCYETGGRVAARMIGISMCVISAVSMAALITFIVGIWIL